MDVSGRDRMGRRNLIHVLFRQQRNWRVQRRSSIVTRSKRSLASLARNRRSIELRSGPVSYGLQEHS